MHLNWTWPLLSFYSAWNYWGNDGRMNHDPGEDLHPIPTENNTKGLRQHCWHGNNSFWSKISTITTLFKCLVCRKDSHAGTTTAACGECRIWNHLWSKMLKYYEKAWFRSMMKMESIKFWSSGPFYPFFCSTPIGQVPKTVFHAIKTI